MLSGAGSVFSSGGARYPSGKGEVCKTFMRRFDSDPRLQVFLFAVAAPRNAVEQRHPETVAKIATGAVPHDAWVQ